MGKARVVEGRRIESNEVDADGVQSGDEVWLRPQGIREGQSSFPSTRRGAD